MSKFHILNPLLSFFSKHVDASKQVHAESDGDFRENVKHFTIIWLDSQIDLINDDDSQITITELKTITDKIVIFNNCDTMLEFMESNEHQRILLMTSGSLGKTIVPDIHERTLIDSICIFCQDVTRHRQWAKAFSKIRGVFNEITPICTLFKSIIQNYHHNLIAMSFIENDQSEVIDNFDGIDQSFMYTQILKEILLTIDFDKDEFRSFIDTYREEFANNPSELKNIEELQNDYFLHGPIWWYTSNSFLYATLNRALRLMQIDRIIQMGFFLRDLHTQISLLHQEQYLKNRNMQKFSVFRGQSLSIKDFNKLVHTRGGLISFNSFLSTSKNKDVSLNFTKRSILNSDSIGILFVIEVDPIHPCTPFAAVKEFSRYQSEREILFSMHSVFRVGSFQRIKNENDRLWQVSLTLTNTRDPQRQALTNRMREETQGLSGWHRLGRLLIILGQYSKAEDLYQTLLVRSTDELDVANHYHHLAAVKDAQGDHQKAIEYYEKSIEINTRNLHNEHPNLATSYTGLGFVYSKMGNYEKSIAAHSTALKIVEKQFLANHHHIAICYGHIGRVLDQMGEHHQALESHQKALEIFRDVLPYKDPHVATCYSDIGQVFCGLENIDQALFYHQKALDFRKKLLHPNHHLLATSYSNVGELLIKKGEESRGLQYLKIALDIAERSLPNDHPNLQTYRENVDRYNHLEFKSGSI